MTNISLGQTIDGGFTQNDSKDTRGNGYFVDEYELTGLSNWQQVEVSFNRSTLRDAPKLRLINANTDEIIGLTISTFSLSEVQPPIKIAFTVYPGVDYKLEGVAEMVKKTTI